MFERKKIQSLREYFLPRDKRQQNTVYFTRICGCSEEIKAFLAEYYHATRMNGAVVEGKIPNPDGKNLSFFQEMMGTDFKLEKGFFVQSLNRWLPRMNSSQYEVLADSLYAGLTELANRGKNENVIKNSYIKFMCWMYYRFEGIVNRLGQADFPKILCDGSIGIYELYMLSILNRAGCDVVLLVYDNDSEYSQIDPRSLLSDRFEGKGLSAFPQGYSIDSIRLEFQARAEREKLYGAKPSVLNCTNAWLKGNILEDIKTAPVTRGNDKNLFYNAFCRMYGAEDKITYQNDLYRFYLEIKNSGRNYLIAENSIPVPTANEISRLRRGNYANNEQMLSDMSSRLRFPQNPELQKLMVKAFLDVMLEEAAKPDSNVNKLSGKAVHLVCWTLRYMQALFLNWSMPLVGVFIYLGGCKNECEVLFLKMLSKLPCDVLILVPNLNSKCLLEDKTLYEMRYTQTLVMNVFPTENSGLQIATAAYHAERDLDEVMYSGTGIYRNFQYSRANTVTLKTMYEEISILWDQELRFRPNFSTIDETVNIPVIFAKISGVKDSNVAKYWQNIKGLLTEDTFVIGSPPYIQPNSPNPFKQNITLLFKNGKLQRNAIVQNRYYQYGVLRPETQNYILDKLQALIDSRVISGTFVNGTEYAIVATILNLQTDIIRLIQKFDFTKKNPKIIYINTGDFVISLEDAIVTAFLNQIGFDVVFFVPTGYRTVEMHFSRDLLDEHQIGEYMYDLQVPKFKIPAPKPSKGTKGPLFKNIFKKGK